MKKQMINLNINTIIYKPVKLVFDFMSTPENDFQWQYGTLASARLSEGTNTIGSFFRSIGHLMGQRAQGTFEVIWHRLGRNRFYNLLRRVTVRVGTDYLKILQYS
ncbi:MAG: hypothetical protein IPG80_00930 [Anaerolineales bacterium]|uniref:hypothetical protein n=1 Tax=Candidatus Villigracilis vicinus TaxID=3140679 RepID=UPI0031371CEC|nr:hypothetical protein [Anaerolineales bacterium]